VTDDKLKIAGTPDTGRAYQDKLQQLGRELVGSLHMLIKNVKLYAPDNAIFVKPLEKAESCINTIIAMEGRFTLQGAGESFYLNSMQVKLDLKSLDTTRYLAQEFERCNVGGFSLDRAINTGEIQNFMYIFSNDNTEPAGESGVSARKLMALKLRKFEKIKEILQNKQEGEATLDQSKLDRKRYALVVYARAVQFMRSYLAGIRGEGPELPASKAIHLIQDLVDISFEQSAHFLGLVTATNNEDYLAFHSVGVTLLSIVFGVEVGLSKEQLRELGQAALFHDIGKAGLDGALLRKTGKLTPYEERLLQRCPVETVKRKLRTGNLARTGIHDIIVAYDNQRAYGRAIKDLSGNISMVEKTADLSVYTKIVALADCYETLTSLQDYGPDIALSLMNTDLKQHFDPGYLKIFGRILKGLARRVVSAEGEKVSIF
jgi:HD-GYP domain-containing protein (c-di-GMP phosphodiesterase class II)